MIRPDSNPSTRLAVESVEQESWERSNWCLACGHWIALHKNGRCEFAVHACDCSTFVDPVLALRAYYLTNGLPETHR